MLVLCLVTLLFIPSLAHAKTLIVGVDYPAISDALKKAKNGDVIEVKAGQYKERLKIDKAVYLKGINNPTIIENGGHIATIASRGVTMEGFTIVDENPSFHLESAGIYISKGADEAVIKNNRLHGVMHGVWSVGARGIRIENNTIESKKALERNYRGNGIYLIDSQEAIITGNRINYCRDGIYIEVSHDGKFIDNDIRNSRYAVHTMWVDRSVFSKNTAIGNLVGIAIMYSRQSEITDNTAVGNSTHGILLIQAIRSHIARNTVIGNTKGIYFYNSVYNSMDSNLIMNNSLGLHSWGGSEDNTVTRNSFIGNEIQVKFVAGRNQQWDSNYWSDYLGWDMAGDGIGDSPYESNTVVDHILWRYPAAKLLYASPSFQLLWILEKQFPLLKVPRVVDTKPSMLPSHKDWKKLKAEYPYAPEKYYGEIEKMPIIH
ncbi:MAG: nitrous oxide reductase family maturation protein NosD [Nitrospirota bacterium]